MRKIPPDTDTFTFYNANPKNRRTEDCVYRALAVAVNLPWATIIGDMAAVAQETGYAPTSKEAISYYLKKRYNIEMYKQPRHSNNRKYTGKEFCKSFNRGTYIISIGTGHISVVKKGKIIDIWDCSDNCVGNYWLLP